jgi:hypothetical protein
MRLFLDQMFRLELAEHLRTQGHDVVRAGEVGLARADDADIMQQAIDQERAGRNAFHRVPVFKRRIRDGVESVPTVR